MNKLLVALLLGLYLVFRLGGDDPGLLRPGLANVDPATLVPARIAEPVEVRSLDVAAAPAPRDTTILTSASSTKAEVDVPAATARDVVQARYSPDPGPVAAAPAQRQADKVFTLSALPGQVEPPVDIQTDAQAEAEVDAPVDASGGQVWYVTGRSVNVRQGPSTDAPIVGKLLLGDAALVVSDTGAGWAEVTVEGDGVSGYVSTDYLSPEAP